MPRKASKTGVLDTHPRFRIGAVSRLTKIPVDTLRVWERRYAVVAPNRDLSPVRLYNQDDVERLVHIKRLTDVGHAIGCVANLSRAELEAMLALHEGPAHAEVRDDSETAEVCCYGDSRTSLDIAKAALDGVTVLGQYNNWMAFELDVMVRAPTAMVIELAALMPQRVDEILRLFWRSAVLRVIVCYGFSQAALVQRLEAEGVIALQSPVGPSQIIRELRRSPTEAPAQLGATRADAAPRILEDEVLLEIERRSTTVDCECPHHLVGIIRTLNEFEFYSANCEHRGADDAVLHAMLRASTAQARALMERALVKVAEFEDIPLPRRARDSQAR